MRLAAADHRLCEWEKLLDELTPRQLAVLSAFDRIERIGEERQDERAAVCTAAIASAVSLSGKPVDPKKIFDVLRPKKPERVLSPDQVVSGMRRTRPR